MKKIFLLTTIALLFSTSCLTLLPQTESAPVVNPTAAATSTTEATSTTAVTSTKAPRIITTPKRIPTSTPLPTETVIPPTPHWTLSAPSPADRSTYMEDLAPEYQSILEGLPYASLYSIEFNIADSLTHVTGHEDVTYFNAEDVDLNQVALRLFPNILGGEMTVQNIAVNNRKVKSSLSLENSLLVLKLNEELSPGESVAIEMDFEITVAESLGAHYSVQAYYDNVLTLAHAYPMIAVYDDEGWNAEIPPPYGDITYADMALYVVTVEAPAQLTLVAAGREISREESSNRQRVVYAAGPVRDFFLAASPNYSIVTREINGITLRFYAREFHQSGAEFALDAAARAIEIFSERYAPSPYRELDFVSTPTTAGGMEYPGAIAIADQYIMPDNIYLEAITAHEVGHQWFYNLVGNDQLDEPWLDEALAQFMTLGYFEETGGAKMFHTDLENRWRMVNNEPIPIGLPVSAYDEEQYGAIIYGRGALFFEALRDEMGADNFKNFMRAYVHSNAWGIVTAETLKRQAEEACDCSLNQLFGNWVYP
jgi:hypothetical protein